MTYNNAIWRTSASVREIIITVYITVPVRSRAVTLGVRRVGKSELEYLVASYILVPWVVVGDTEHNCL